MYPEKLLKDYGFQRMKCKKCGKFFWGYEKRDFCGDCEEKYYFLERRIANREFDYIEAWKEFEKFMKRYGYESVRRYPVIPRWRDDVFFVQASIYDFQPHVVSGEVPPPKNPLIVPQFSIRFNDIENVGITGRHYTGFVMIGRHYFGKDYNTNELYKPILDWVLEGMKIPIEEITIIEDSWEGGGNAGPSLEIFSGGLELLNTVFMIYKVTESGYKPLSIKVLDEGSGQERWAWFTKRTPSSYQVVFPTVIEYIEKSLGERIDRDFLKRFMIKAKDFDITEYKFSTEDIEKITGISREEIENKIFLYKDIFVIADHTRTLLFSIKDGAIPSNTGQGYFLRLILRRIFEIMKRRSLEIDLRKIFELHMKFLKEEFPDIYDKEFLDIIDEIVKVEEEKWRKTREKAKRILSKIREIDEEKARELYESHGITPEMMEEFGIKVPENVYLSLIEFRKKDKKKEKRIQEEIPEIETEPLFYKDPYLYETRAKVLKILGNKVILDKTIFYPESGGQKYDLGYIGNSKVLRVYKVGKTIVHEVDSPKFSEGEIVDLKIDQKRRMRLMRHHTGTHILIASIRRVLGKHVWQQGAEKDEEIARLDISHFKDISIDEIQEIERLANQVIFEGRPVRIYWMDRNEAEERFGFIIYQGGVVPGKEIRIVEIENWDVQACGGLHLNNTRDALLLKIVKVEKIKDGVYRFWFKCGDVALEEIQKRDRQLLELSREWKIPIEEVKKRAIRFFEEWKEHMKRSKKLEDWVIKKIPDWLKEKDFLEIPSEIEVGKVIAVVKRLEKEGMEDKAIKVGDKFIILGDPRKFGEIIEGKTLEREMGKIGIYS